MNTYAPMNVSGAMITLMPNAHRQEKFVVRNPPTTGPTAAATPAVAPHAANAVARSRPSNVPERIASVAGSMKDAPMPSMIASPRIRPGTPCESAAINEPVPNSAVPIMKMRRWPYTSPSRPPMINSVANVNA